MARRRVAVTGIGCVTAAGSGSDFWPAILDGRAAIAALDAAEGERLAIPAAARVDDFSPSDHMDKRIVLQTDRHTQFGLAAARMALADAELTPDSVDVTRVGVVLSNNLGGSQFGEEQLVNLHTRGAPHVSAYMAIAWFYAATIGQISIRYGFRGYAKTHIGERAGAHIALGDALRAVQRGDVDVCLTGGCEAPLTPYALLGYRDSQLLSESGAYRPYTSDRDGLVVGEGAAILVFEEWEHARARGARIYAEVLGFGGTCDAVHHRDAAADGREYARAVRLALADGDVAASDVRLAVLDSSAGREADIREGRALRQAFAGDLASVRVSCSKVLVGHTFGAAGAIDCAVATLSLYNHVATAVRTDAELDPECDVPLVRGRLQFISKGAAVVAGTGRGGINAAVVLAVA